LGCWMQTGFLLLCTSRYWLDLVKTDLNGKWWDRKMQMTSTSDNHRVLLNTVTCVNNRLASPWTQYFALNKSRTCTAQNESSCKSCALRMLERGAALS
jgi:hypothetical protein